MKPKTVAFFILLFLAHHSIGQSPYSLDWRKDLTITAIGLASTAGSYWVGAGVEPLSLEEINNADRSGLNVLDRIATKNISFKAHQASNYLLYGAHLLPFVFLADHRSKNELAQIAVMAGETFITTTGLTLLTKNIVLRPRPFVYNEDTPLSAKQTKSARYSFFSGHASTTAAMGVFTAKVYADLHPDSKWKPLVWGAALTLPAVTGLLRVKGGKHYPTDVATGYIVGATIGYLVPHLHKKNGLRDKGLSLYSSGNSMLVQWQF